MAKIGDIAGGVSDRFEGALIATALAVASDVFVKVVTEERMKKGMDVILDPLEDAIEDRVENPDIVKMLTHATVTARAAFGVPDNDEA